MAESSSYREWTPPPHLAAGVACLWTHVTDGSTSGVVLPDGCCDVIWRAGHGAFVAGPDTGPVRNRFPTGTTFVGLRFRPGAGAAGLGLPLDEVVDRRVPIEGLGSVDADFRPELTPSEAASRLAGMATRALAAVEPDPVVAEAIEVLRDPRQRLGAARDRTGVSERQLRRRFVAAVGYGPKTLQRVLRFRAFLDRADEGVPLADAAARAGYADQAHLNRESRDLAGLTPAALVAGRR